MQYREKIMELMFGDYETFTNWIHSHDELDAVEIMREYAAIVKEIFAEKGLEFPEEMLEDLLEKADNYEEKVLDAHYHNLQYELSVADLDKHIEAFYDDIDVIKNEAKQAIALYPEQATEIIKQLAIVIAYEKRKGLYNPINWIGLE